MIINTIKEDIKAPICIIGSGIGGGTLVQKLYEQKKGFVVIEAGSLKGNSNNVNYENIGLDFGVRTTTTIQVGGTSNLWHGVLAPLDKIDFQKRDWIPYSGWPIQLSDMDPYYKEASKVLNVESYDYFEEDKLSKGLSEELNSLPFNREFLKNKLFQQSLPEVNFKRVVVDICKDSKHYHLCYNTTALELVTNNGKITKLKVGVPNGKTYWIEATTFIMASGALETPRLLLNSKIKNKNIGRFLMDHPMGNLCQIEFKKPAKYPLYSDTKYSSKMKIKTGLEFKEEKQKELQLPNHNFYLRPSFIKGINNESEKLKLSFLAFKDGGLKIKDIWKVITNPNVIRQIMTYKFSLDVTFKYADLFFVTEQIPNPNSSVTLSEKKDTWGYPISKVNWQVKKEDIDGVKKWFELLLTKLFPEEYYKFTHTINDFDWENVFTSAIHHVGTARMSETSEKGVVDKNLKVHGYNNLYICDGSIFTTAGNVNNGLTICAFACRLVDFIKKQNENSSNR